MLELVLANLIIILIAAGITIGGGILSIIHIIIHTILYITLHIIHHIQDLVLIHIQVDLDLAA